MAFNDLKITQIKLDNKNRVWASGQDISYYDGNTWNYLNYQNSALPSNEPYYLDTRCLSIDQDQAKWIGCANGPCISDVAVTKLYGQNQENSESWTFTELGYTGGYYQCPVIEASPYGSDVLAFINELNDGIGVTGTTGFTGATAGNLLIYNTISKKWRNILGIGNNIPRVYSITPRGIDGRNYEYWVGTANGIWILKNSFYDTEELYSESDFVPNVRVLTSENSGLPGNVVRDIKFDENGNVWIATESGFSFYDFDTWRSWDTTSFANLSTNTITKIVVRKNGHIFLTSGDGELKQGTGLYHFNGTSLDKYDVSSGDLPNNNIVSMELIAFNTQNGDLRNYTNDLWVSCYNDLVQFSYVIPHVRATSDYEGATGWDFVSYQNSDSISLPKADKYTWSYPSWSGEDFSYLLRNHPGTDPRLIFTNNELETVIDGLAGDPNYYSAGPIPLFSETELAEGLTGASFIFGATGGTCYITSSAFNHDNLILGGFTDSPVINFGYKNSLNYTSLTNPNPTNLGFPVPAGSNQNVGFIAYYSKKGQIKGYIPFRGKSTKILSVTTGLEDSSIYVAGTFRGYIEIGKFVYNNIYPNASNLVVTGVTGPTGGPIGFSSLYLNGITGPSFDYPWILNGPTASVPGPFIPDPSLITNDSEAIFIAEIDYNLGSSSSFGDINFSATGDLERSYRIKNFRYFPSAPTEYDPSGATGYFGSLDQNSFSISSTQKWIDLSLGVSGGYATLTGQWENIHDLPNQQDFIFSSYTTAYKKSGSLIQMDRDLNLYSSLTSSGTGDTAFSKSVSDSSSSTILISGTSNQNFTFGSTGSTGYNGLGQKSFMLVSDRGGNVTSSGIQFINNGIDSDQINLIPVSDDGVYTVLTVSQPTPSFSLNNSAYSITGGTSIYGQTFTPNGLIQNQFSFPISNSYGYLKDSLLNNRNELILNVNEMGSTGSTGSIVTYKFSKDGDFQDSKILSNMGTVINDLVITQDSESNLYYTLTYNGSTGPANYPYPSTVDTIPKTLVVEQHQPKIGVNYGNVDSRYGEGAWNWSDVHLNGTTFKIPMLSTAFITNYPSNIYGKNMNTWRLFDSRSGEKILDVKGVPYFIYTFTNPGYYTLENSVEDANGNVYEVSRNAFVQVVDHTVKREDDPNPLIVNSSDYGYTVPGKSMEIFISNLSKDMLEEQMRILKESGESLKGSPLLLRNDPDATFRPLED